MNARRATNSDCYRVLLPLFPGVFSYSIILQMLIDAEGQPSNHVNIPNVTQMVILEDMGHLTLLTSSIYLYHTQHAFAQSYPTLCDPSDCSPPDSSVHGVFQARILEWVLIPSPGDLLDPGIKPRSLHCRQILYQFQLVIICEHNGYCFSMLILYTTTMQNYFIILIYIFQDFP